MTESIEVKCSGALFAALQYELLNSRKIQEGFFLGEVEKLTSHSISDSEIDNEDVIVNINISGYIPCTSVGIFYNGCGRVNVDYLKHFVGYNTKKIVGWYHSRKFSESLYLKEMRIHEQLRDEMHHTNGHFLFALFSRIQPAISGTMDINYKFHIMLNNNEFQAVSLSIVNMNDTSTSQYIRTDFSSALYKSKSLQTVLEDIKNIEPGVKEAEMLHNGLMNRLRTLLPKYASIQEQYHVALQKVVNLREHCHNCEINIDREPISSKPREKSSNLSANEKNDGKNDPFDFIENEMVIYQESDLTKKSSKVKEEQGAQLTKTENDDANNTKSKKNPKIVPDSESPRFRSLNEKGRSFKSSSSVSPIRKVIKDNTSNENSTPRKTRSLRGAKLGSVDDVHSNGNVRRQIPPEGIKNSQSKPKETEAWGDNKDKMCSDSPEF